MDIMFPSNTSDSCISSLGHWSMHGITYVMMLESRILFGFLVMRSKTRPLEIQVRYPQPLPSTTLLGRPGL